MTPVISWGTAAAPAWSAPSPPHSTACMCSWGRCSWAPCSPYRCTTALPHPALRCTWCRWRGCCWGSWRRDSRCRRTARRCWWWYGRSCSPADPLGSCWWRMRSLSPPLSPPSHLPILRQTTSMFDKIFEKANPQRYFISTYVRQL